MRFNKLRGRIVEKYGTMCKFAEKIRTTRQTVSQKLTGKIEFSRDDIQRWAGALDIDTNEIGVFFFEQ